MIRMTSRIPNRILKRRILLACLRGGIASASLWSLAALTTPAAWGENPKDVALSSWLVNGPASPIDVAPATETQTPGLVQQSNYDYDYATSEAELATQVAELRLQLTSQSHELALLQSRVNNAHAKTSSNPRWFVGYESVLLQPVQSNATGVIVETPTGYSHVMFPWQLVHSPRVEFGLDACGDALGWRFRYWQFRHGESFEANSANGLIPLGNEGTVGYLSEDGDITTGLAFIEQGEFFSHIRTDVIDSELQRAITESLDFYAGLRYAKVSQAYRAVTDQGSANAFSEFRGFGPTVALQFTHLLPVKSLSLFATLRGSALFGQKDYAVVDSVNNLQQQLNAIDVRSYSDGIDSFAGSAEAQLGLRYTPADCCMFKVALETQHFADVGGPNPTGVFTGPDSGLAGDGPLDDNLSFVGLTIGAELGW
jgi:hypothetical protein